QFLIRIKFLHEVKEDEWVIEDKMTPVKTGREKGLENVLSRDTKPGVLTGIDKPYYENCYPVTAVVYRIYPIRDPDPANLAPLTSTVWPRELWSSLRAL
ncbi:MAG: hypothetical protein AB2556_23215, partial [Candidatus Thiodiazotropha sp.]